MDQRPDRFTAFIDANVLIPALKRNILLSLAHAGLFRARWSETVLKEVEANLPEAAPGMSAETAQRQRTAIEDAFPEALVEGFEALQLGLEGLPDPKDAHVIAAAKQCGAAVIVTDNLKDFPADRLAPLGIQATRSDAFLADAIDIDMARALSALARMRARFKKPELTPERLLTRMRERGLATVAELLAPHHGRL